MLNREKIDKIQSYQQIVDHFRTSDIPLSILTRGLPDESGGEWPDREFSAISQRVQYEFKQTSTSSRHRIAGRSGHDIHHDEPELVQDEIMYILKGIEK